MQESKETSSDIDVILRRYGLRQRHRLFTGTTFDDFQQTYRDVDHCMLMGIFLGLLQSIYKTLNKIQRVLFLDRVNAFPWVHGKDIA